MAKTQRKQRGTRENSLSKECEQKFWMYVWTIKLAVLLIVFFILFFVVRRIIVR